ncbi:MAG: hypothetical protein IPN33_19970 [Saprospiraceae bacterium]|nr:hypothetical protein [Saprospiraceae bacterium]
MLKNLKSLFIVEEEGAQGPKGEQKTMPGTTQAPQGDTPAEAGQAATPGAGQVNQQFLEVLFKAMQENNLGGFDYLEFKQSLRSLEKMPMDEPTRFQSAFAMAQTLGATAQTLVQTAEHYLNIIKQEENKFNQAHNAQREKQIGNKENEIKQLEEVARTKMAQIAQLTKEIEAHKQKAGALKKEIEDAVVKVETTKNNFVASYNALVEQIGRDVENMKRYLK